MKNHRDDNNLLRGAFPKTTQEVKKSQQVMDDLEKRRRPTQLFAVTSQGEVTDHFKVFTSSGSSYAIKYAHLPYIVLDGEVLMILLGAIQVIIVGRNLDIVEDYVSKNELIWIKPSPSGKDDGQSRAFIREIKIDGPIYEKVLELKDDI